MADDDKTLEDPAVMRRYLAVIGGLNLVTLGYDELERIIVSCIRTPEVDVLRLVQALLEARLEIKAMRARLVMNSQIGRNWIRLALREAGVELPEGSTIEVMATAIRGLVDPRVAVTEGLFSAAQIDAEPGPRSDYDDPIDPDIDDDGGF
jgi:hypothetical protein